MSQGEAFHFNDPEVQAEYLALPPDRQAVIRRLASMKAEMDARDTDPLVQEVMLETMHASLSTQQGA